MTNCYILLQVLHERDHGHVEPEAAAEADEERQPSAARAPAQEEDRAAPAAHDGRVGDRPRLSLRVCRDDARLTTSRFMVKFTNKISCKGGSTGYYT